MGCYALATQHSVCVCVHVCGCFKNPDVIKGVQGGSIDCHDEK